MRSARATSFDLFWERSSVAGKEVELGQLCGGSPLGTLLWRYEELVADSEPVRSLFVR